ncbi:MAG: GNAT family N-acetyltransferase [Solirubrobacterales bacterium]
MSIQTTNDITIRRHLRDGDAGAIADLHRRVYGSEYGLNERFVEGVRRGLDVAVASGWPQRGGAVWLVDGEEGLRGALGLTDEGEGAGRVRWLVLDQSLRGRGLGRSLVAELLHEARATGMHTLTLETYSDLTAAARIYRDAGFQVQWERVHDDWGPPVTFQGYALDL